MDALRAGRGTRGPSALSSERRIHEKPQNPSTPRDAATGVRLADYSFREAGEQDVPEIETLFEGLGVKPGWAGWKYFGNPAGAARVFVAVDSHKRIVGTLAHMPRQFTTPDGEFITAYLVVDAYVDRELRSRGVFLRLMEYAQGHLEGMRYSVPNRDSGIFGLGRDWRVLGSYRRWQFPLSCLADGPLGFIAPLISGLLRIRARLWLPFAPKHLEMIRITRFSRDFELDGDAAHGVRTAAHLNWRFIDNPAGGHRVYEFFDKGELIGYCVLELSGSEAELSDFVARRHVRGCLRLVIDHCRLYRVSSICMHGVGLSVGKLGFTRSSPERDCTTRGLPDGDWIVMPCDVHACVPGERAR